MQKTIMFAAFLACVIFIVAILFNILWLQIVSMVMLLASTVAAAADKFITPAERSARRWQYTAPVNTASVDQ